VTTGITIPARGHYLFVNSAASAGLTALADQAYGTGFTDDGGVAITQADGTILDQVGLSAGSAYGEGAPLASLGAANLDHSYERRLGGANGSSLDANDNASDFQLTTPSDPQDLASVITPGSRYRRRRLISVRSCAARPPARRSRSPTTPPRL
jgi:hypothetical protein